MRFLVPSPERIPEGGLKRAHLTGADGAPSRCRAVVNGDGIAVDRAGSESGNFHIPWYVDGHGELLLSSASLMDRTAAYHLPIELARGTLHRIRNQLFQWQAAGMIVAPSLINQLREATRCFSAGVTNQQNASASSEMANRAVQLALDVARSLANDFAEQWLVMRRGQQGKLQTLFGVRLDQRMAIDEHSDLLRSMCNSAMVPMTWREIENGESQYDWSETDRQVKWCTDNHIRICSGPLIELSLGSVPDWLCLWEDDFQNMLSLVDRYIQQVVKRYAGKIHLWQCCARTNTSDTLNLNEEQRLKLSVHAIESVLQVDDRTPIMLTLDQPWGEGMLRKDMDLSPLYFADALVRADLGIAAIGLEINLGYYPFGTLNRDLVQIGQLLDRWSVFGLPLSVTLTVPGGIGIDEQARVPCEFVQLDRQPLSDADSLTNSPLKNSISRDSDHSDSAPETIVFGNAPSGFSQQQQADALDRLLPFLLAKPAVQAIFYNQLSDASPHDFPHGGLLDASGIPKPAVESMRSVRGQHVL